MGLLGSLAEHTSGEGKLVFAWQVDLLAPRGVSFSANCLAAKGSESSPGAWG